MNDGATHEPDVYIDPRTRLRMWNELKIPGRNEAIHRIYAERARTYTWPEDTKLNTDVYPTQKDGDGKSYAYVVLIMYDDSYTAGGIAFAHSLRKTGTNHDIVCMVTDDVSQSARTDLAKVYDRVIDVPYISVKYDVKFNKTPRYKWIDKAFTKFNMYCLNYDKVVYLEVDMVVKSNIDDLFNMRTPAAPFQSINGYPLGTLNICPSWTLKHGDPIQPWMVDESLGNYGCGPIGCLHVIEPDISTYDEMVEWFLANINQLAEARCLGTNVEEIAWLSFITKHKKQPMYNVDLKYAWVPWRRIEYPDCGKEYRDIRVYHMFGEHKPWVMRRSAYVDDYWELWWNSFSSAVLEHKIDPGPYVSNVVDIAVREPDIGFIIDPSNRLNMIVGLYINSVMDRHSAIYGRPVVHHIISSVGQVYDRYAATHLVNVRSNSPTNFIKLKGPPRSHRLDLTMVIADVGWDADVRLAVNTAKTWCRVGHNNMGVRLIVLWVMSHKNDTVPAEFMKCIRSHQQPARGKQRRSSRSTSTSDSDSNSDSRVVSKIPYMPRSTTYIGNIATAKILAHTQPADLAICNLLKMVGTYITKHPHDIISTMARNEGIATIHQSDESYVEKISHLFKSRPPRMVGRNRST